MLTRVIPLMRELGVDIGWDVIEGSPEFYNVTKKFHNALHGRADVIVDRDLTYILKPPKNIIRIQR